MDPDFTYDLLEMPLGPFKWDEEIVLTAGGDEMKGVEEEGVHLRGAGMSHNGDETLEEMTERLRQEYVTKHPEFLASWGNEEKPKR